MQLGNIVKAKVNEVMSDGSLIMSFQGKLIRVVNKSNREYKEEEWVQLRVKKLQPLEFQLI